MYLNGHQLAEFKPHVRWADGIFMTIITVCFSLFLAFKAIDFFILDENIDKAHDYFFALFKSLYYHNTVAYLNFWGQNLKFALQFWCVIFSFLCGALYLSFTNFFPLVDGYEHLQGRRFLTGRKALASAKRATKGMAGLELIKDVHLSLKQECLSILVCGAQGGGKTQIINNLLTRAIARNDKAVIYDLTKGDFTHWTDCPIISTTDARSWHWWLGVDVTTLEDASTFALTMIPPPPTGDPFWTQTAQNVMIACITKLQRERGNNWSFPHLSNLLFQTPIDDLKTICDTFYGPAYESIIDAQSKTTQSILVSLHVACAPIYRLNLNWQHIDKCKRISLINWLNNDNSKIRQIIIQGDQVDEVLSADLARTITRLLTTRIASLQFPESKTRRLWFFLDELPQIGRLESISTLMSVGRSKGVRAVFGFQDVAQIRQIYAEHEIEKWMALFGLRIFPKVRGSVTQNFVSEQVGNRIVAIKQKTVGGLVNSGQISVSTTKQRIEIPVILPSETETLFGPAFKDASEQVLIGSDALVVGLTQDALKLRFAPCSPTEIRVSHEPRKLHIDVTKSEQVLNAMASLSVSHLPTIEQENQKITAEKSQVKVYEMLFDEPYSAVTTIENNTIVEIKNEVADTIIEEVSSHVLSEALGVDSHILSVVETVIDANSSVTRINDVLINNVEFTHKKRQRKIKSVEREA